MIIIGSVQQTDSSKFLDAYDQFAIPGPPPINANSIHTSTEVSLVDDVSSLVQRMCILLHTVSR